jgi:hypothetical protein
MRPVVPKRLKLQLILSSAGRDALGMRQAIMRPMVMLDPLSELLVTPGVQLRKVVRQNRVHLVFVHRP